MMWKSKAFALLILAALSLSGCGKKEADKPAAQSPSAPPKAAANVPSGVDVDKASDAMWLQLEANISQASDAVETLHSQIELLLISAPDADLSGAQNAWLETEAAIQSLNFLFRLAQSTPKHLQAISKLDYLIAAQPIQPGYLDSFGAYPYSGLVHDIGTPISKETLLQQHGLTDSEEVLLGVYAIEYLLFGEDASRPASDFAEQDQLSQEDRNNGLENISEAANNRRRALLRTQTALLLEHVQLLVSVTRRDSDIRVQPNWRQQSDYQQWHSANEALKRSIAQSLIELVALRIEPAPAPEEEGEEQSEPESDIPEAIQAIPEIGAKAKSISLKLEASTAVLGFVPSKSRKDVRESIELALSELEEIHNYSDIETHNAKVQRAYEALSRIKL